MEPGSYFSTMNNSKDKQRLRYPMVQYARETSITESTRYFRTTRKTVRKWIVRFEEEGYLGLADRSRAPHTCPHKSTKAVEKRVLKLREEVPWGAERIREQWGEMALPCGIGAFKRIIRSYGKQRPRRKKKSQRKRDLRAAKAGLPPMQEFRMDSKYLTDLAAYYPQMLRLGLPRFQYTIRELPTGGQWVSYADELSMDYATQVAKRFLLHLRACGVNLSQVSIQTDWGSEYDGASRIPKPNGFIRTIESLGAHHRSSPPGCPNANADVETVHATIEEEFFHGERFGSRDDFLRKVTTYQHWYNLCRKNRSKGWRAPLDILKEKTDQISPAVMLLSPILLEDWPRKSIPTPPKTQNLWILWVDTLYPSLTEFPHFSLFYGQLSIPFLYFRPGIPQSYRAVEHELVWCGIDRIDAEISETLELAGLPSWQALQRGLHEAVIEHL